jgi:hypothetical protein
MLAMLDNHTLLDDDEDEEDDEAVVTNDNTSKNSSKLVGKCNANSLLLQDGW